MSSKTFKLPKNKNAGIYMLYNITEHKAYIGSTNNFYSRALTHRTHLNKGIHSNKKLQADYDKGCEFTFAVLEEFEKEYDKNRLLEREKIHILAFRGKRIDVYNLETDESIMFDYIYRLFQPMKDEIYKNFREMYGCEIRSLICCNPDTVKQKFEKFF